MNRARSTSTTSTTESAKPYRGRRMSWEEFRKLMKEAANDNERPGEKGLHRGEVISSRPLLTPTARPGFCTHPRLKCSPPMAPFDLWGVCRHDRRGKEFIASAKLEIWKGCGGVRFFRHRHLATPAAISLRVFLIILIFLPSRALRKRTARLGGRCSTWGRTA